LKQITGWFTNNRKRKYNRVLALAKKRGRNLDYVRDVMIMKFDKDLDKSLSGRSNQMQEAKRHKRDASKIQSDQSAQNSVSDRNCVHEQPVISRTNPDEHAIMSVREIDMTQQEQVAKQNTMTDCLE